MFKMNERGNNLKIIQMINSPDNDIVQSTLCIHVYSVIVINNIFARG